jgi:hypothetical protein
MNFPKVLVAAPQHISKLYCWDAWANNVTNFTYPNFDVFLSDNSPSKEFKPYVEQRGFLYHHTPKNHKGLLFTINDAHEACRKYALEHNYDAVLHLETDVIPPIDIIERLMSHGKNIIAACYDIKHGAERQAMVQLLENVNGFTKAFKTTDFVGKNEGLFFDGTVKQVYSAGLGCILLRKPILNSFAFMVKDNTYHSDVWFANELMHKNIPIFLDTSIQCQHLNDTWKDKL